MITWLLCILTWISEVYCNMCINSGLYIIYFMLQLKFRVWLKISSFDARFKHPCWHVKIAQPQPPHQDLREGGESPPQKHTRDVDEAVENFHTNICGAWPSAQPHPLQSVRGNQSEEQKRKEGVSTSPPSTSEWSIPHGALPPCVCCLKVLQSGPRRSDSA